MKIVNLIGDIQYTADTHPPDCASIFDRIGIGALLYHAREASWFITLDPYKDLLDIHEAHFWSSRVCQRYRNVAYTLA